MDPFEKRVLGRTGLEVTQLGFGAAQLGELSQTVPETEAQEAIAAAYEAGVNFWDTSPWYGIGLSEHRLGHDLRARPRDSFVLSTKVGRVMTRPADVNQVDKEPWVGGLLFNHHFDYSYDGVMRSYEDSLMRLSLNRVDLLLIHDLDRVEHGSEDAVEAYLRQLDGGGFKALDQLRAAGEIKGIGAGINLADMVPGLLGRFDLDVLLVAMPYSLLDQSPAEQLALCAERNIGVIKGAPYASGILASDQGSFNYGRAPETIVAQVRAIHAVCERHGVALRAAALQFLLAHPAVATVIPGPRSKAELLDNIEMVQAPIPHAFWAEMKAEGLIAQHAPTP